jgi:hypothetical protein
MKKYIIKARKIKAQKKLIIISTEISNVFKLKNIEIKLTVNVVSTSITNTLKTELK